MDSAEQDHPVNDKEVVDWQTVRDNIATSSDEELMEMWSAHYVDPSEREIPVMLSMVLCHAKMVEVRTLPYDQVETIVEMHRKVRYPGWVVGMDIITGKVLFQNANIDDHS